MKTFPRREFIKKGLAAGAASGFVALKETYGLFVKKNEDVYMSYSPVTLNFN